MPTTPNMNMTLPTVGVTVDPTWASNLNDALTNKVDLHDHTSGLGVQVPTAGININADLSFQSNDATNLRSLSLNNNVSTLPSGDIRALYASGGNLYYNNNSGNAVRITSGSSLDTGSLALNVWELTELAGNLTIPSNASYVFINTNTSVTRTITLPAASGVTAGRYFIIKDKTGSANTNNITITPAGSDTIDGVASSTTVTSAYGSTTLVSDGVGGWLTNAALGGFVQLGGDLLGTGTTTTAPRVSGLTGISGLVTMANDTAINSRNTANDTNINIAKINTSNQVLLGDTAFATNVRGTTLNILGTTTTINASSTSVAVSGATTATLQAGSGNALVGSTSADVRLVAGDDVDIDAGDDITIDAVDSVAITGNSGAVTLTSASAAITASASTDINLTALNGDVNITGNDDIVIATDDLISLSALGDTTITCGGDMALTAGDKVTLTGRVHLPTKAVTSSPYTVDTTTKDYIIFVDSTGGAITITLPLADNGRVLIIQDVGGAAGTNNITLARSGSDTIQGLSANYVMDADYQGVTLAAYSGASWFIIGTS